MALFFLNVKLYLYKNIEGKRSDNEHENQKIVMKTMEIISPKIFSIRAFDFVISYKELSSCPNQFVKKKLIQ